MLTVARTSFQEIEEEAAGCDIVLPIEQSARWAHYQNTIEGRRLWGPLMVLDGDVPVAMLSLIEYRTHGYRYLRSMHGPVWTVLPNPALERSVVGSLASFVRHEDPGIVFLRLDTWSSAGALPVLSTVPYDWTVVIDVTGGDEAILSRMKRRGRRDVRKALRECPASVADETGPAMSDFSEYYDVMLETGERDGFKPAPLKDYLDMIEALGPEHCRVFAARIDGRVVAWSIVTVNDTCAVRYYAAMRDSAMRLHVTDRLLYAECCMLGGQGVTDYDLMGIGSDFAPSLKGLNEFKTKFTEETTPVAPARDVPIHRGFYAGLKTLQSIRHQFASAQRKD
ncbi:GNAT family N-acetyltransferase [Bifidobacterium imperatoris]|uniref:GNAT family N-acetyltransferase n=3 Tax=Bifidobacterium imperatoris TaxID=2020965 RepID=A0ABX7S2T1_9BIFI|nr:GNAT family N-acetyltransferase [Bifidobacterium imperatoris]QSY57669.1 GNAT family N-acetyltransferase [Bifidobacterium imperatoris]